MDFDETIQNLKKVCNNPIARECIEIMAENTVLFNPGFIKDKQELSSLYEFRLNVAKNHSRHKFKDDEIENWQIAINQLMQSPSKETELNWVDSDQKFFMMFWDAQTKKLQAIFYLYAKSTLKEQEQNYDKTNERGLSVSSIKYIKGNPVKDWKKT